MEKLTKRQQSLLKELKYFKGEDDNPFDYDTDEHFLWFYERSWMNDIDNNNLHQRNVDELVMVGLEEWAESKTMPITLIAYHFNRFAKFYSSMKNAAQPFKDFMAKHYAI